MQTPAGTFSIRTYFSPVLRGRSTIFSTIGPYELEGTPDLVGEYLGVPSIIDFKTSSRKYDPRQTIADEQMRGYALMLEKEGLYTAEQIVHIPFVKHHTNPRIQTPIIIKLTEETKAGTIENIENTCTEIREKKVFIKNTKQCVSGPIICPFFEKCHGDYKKEKE